MEIYLGCFVEIEEMIFFELGVFIWFLKVVQVFLGLVYFNEIMNVFKEYDFEEQCGFVVVVKEFIGVCGFIMLWNFLINQIVCKVVLVFVVGCMMVVKLFEEILLSVVLFVEIFYEVGCLFGVFNFVNGDGFMVGLVILFYLDIDMVFFIGLICVGIQVVKDVVDMVKWVY